MNALLIRSERVVLPDGVRPAAVQVRDGRIVDVSARTERVAGARELDAGDLVVMPGVVDTHVHVNEPGRAEWEGFAHATRAAAAGGVTTVVDMPLNSVPPTTTIAGWNAKRRAAAGQCHVDVGLWGGIVPGNLDDIEPLASAGALGFKCFLSPSGVAEFAHVGEDDLRAALPILARLGLPLLAHAELPAFLRTPTGAPRRHSTWLHSRPAEAEHGAIHLLVRLAREYGAHVHVVHLASGDGLPTLASARAAGVNVTVETCPHYLTFAAEEIPDGATAFKCAPPIRARHHRERLWQALKAGEIDLVATDHSPAPPTLKHLDDGDFVRAWGGIASLQLGLSAVWTGAAARDVPVERLARWLCDGPARLAGLQSRKGRIAAGLDADIAIWDPDAEITVGSEPLHHRHPLTPYAGLTLRGRVRTTIVRGEIVFDDGKLTGPPRGELVRR
jgi:allantoinase